VSVDLIVGLPGQTIEGLVADVRRLVDLGVNGFSLYELQLSPRNRPFALAHSLENRDRLQAYMQIQIASQLLQSLGYRKTLFNHFADDRDTNLYFTFPERGEDCLALGTVADGSFGDYHYRHPEYAAYRRAVTAGFPGLEGGLRRSTQENQLHRLTTALLAGRVPAALLDTLGSRVLLERWQAAELLEEQEDGTLHLTGNGSWFVGNMISEMLALKAN
jgi:oxygen-independent coproporphyrinogen-3 oxidase